MTVKKSIVLAPCSDKSFDLNKLLGQQFYVVLAHRPIKDKCVVLDYEPGEPGNPASDPMILGCFQINDDSEELETRVLWNNKVWRPYGASLVELFRMLSGPKKTAVLKFDDQQPSASVQSTHPR